MAEKKGMATRKSPATMKDIARESGVSINTVSRALRGDTRISEETRTRVSEAAGRLGYIRNNSASSLRSGRTYTVAVIQGDLTNMHNVILLSQIDYHLRKNGYVVMILNSHDSPELEAQLLSQVMSRKVDGIILLPTSSNESAGAIKTLKDRIPLVLVHRTLEGVECDLVEEDDLSGGEQAGELLLKSGRRKLMYIAGPPVNSSEVLRRKGFLRAIEAAGIKTEEVRIVEYEDMVRAVDEQRVTQLLEPVNYDGIFAFYDHFAYQALYSLMREGYRVPEDVMIVGFDYIREAYHYLPPIPSVSTASGCSIAEETVKMLLRRIENPEAEIGKVTLPVCIYGI